MPGKFLYGKIYGGLDNFVRYYLNPHGDRNVEEVPGPSGNFFNK